LRFSAAAAFLAAAPALPFDLAAFAADFDLPDLLDLLDLPPAPGAPAERFWTVFTVERMQLMSLAPPRFSQKSMSLSSVRVAAERSASGMARSNKTYAAQFAMSAAGGGGGSGAAASAAARSAEAVISEESRRATRLNAT